MHKKDKLQLEVEAKVENKAVDNFFAKLQEETTVTSDLFD